MNTANTKLQLPEAPPELAGPVKAWSQPVVMPTYEPAAPDKNPLFLEKRVYQGSSGRVYPLPVIDAISTVPRERLWQALHIENEFIRLMILPEIGGRIHVGLDKTNGYDFFYRQNVIKPALVGLAGPWISGGVEFNWPQHHRPATFMPVDWCLEEHPDGARTIWLSDHDPMNRMKGMHGIHLRPGIARVELKVRLLNRTTLPQTFLWWANAAVHVHEHYQSFFPPDVHMVVDHARRAASTFPRSRGTYYGVPYGRRKSGISPDLMPACYKPTGDYPFNDLRWYANIPVPTSYMAVGSRHDFLGGYDHARKAGVVQIADHHIAPGKKQWTWGNHEFGYAWDRHLTDSDGPYIELMTGVFTDNQPDFSFLAPGETRSFTQYWYPFQKIGLPVAANEHAALSLHFDNRTLHVGIAPAKCHNRLTVVAKQEGKVILRRSGSAGPSQPLLLAARVSATLQPAKLELFIHDDNGLLLHHRPEPEKPDSLSPPPLASEPPMPRAVASNEALYSIGMHLDQYRHATRYPELYWREAIRRDPQDTRSTNAMGLWHLRRGEFAAAANLFQRAVRSATGRNANPYDGEPFYNLGLAHRYLEDDDAAYSSFFKAVWNNAWQAPAFLELARIDCRRGNWPAALEHLDQSLAVSAENVSARNLKVIVLQKLNSDSPAKELLESNFRLDRLDYVSRFLRGDSAGIGTQARFDMALDFARAGLWDMALAALPASHDTVDRGTQPLVHYYRGYFFQRFGRATAAKKSFAAAAKASPDWCFPSRLEEMVILRAAIAANPSDGMAHYYLGNLLYDRKRHLEAVRHWQKASKWRPNYSVIWRNLGIGYYNIYKQPAKAAAAYRNARRCNPADPRLLYEQDQLARRMGVPIHRRIAALQPVSSKAHNVLQHVGNVRAAKNRKAPPAATWPMRDDLTVEYCTLLNQAGRHDEALEILLHRHFQPWEGGEGRVLEQYVRAHMALGRSKLRQGMASEALAHFHGALHPPQSLGEARHALANCSNIFFYLGEAAAAAGKMKNATQWWRRAAEEKGDFRNMAVTPYSEMTFYRILALQRLGSNHIAGKLAASVLAYAKKLLATPAKIDYFATSLPDLLLFEADLQADQNTYAGFLQAQIYFAMGNRRRAIQILRHILRHNAHHGPAADLLAEIAIPAQRVKSRIASR